MATRGYNSGFGRYVHNVASAHGDVPLLRLLLGVLLEGFFVLALMMDVQTSEAFILGGGTVTLHSLNWTLIMQPIQLWQGQITDLSMAKAIMWGWGCLLVYLVCVIGEATVHGRWSGLFKTGAGIIVGFDFYTNLNYGTLPSGLGGQFGFAAITSFIVAFFGVLGIRLIWGALAELFA
jgi:hypothetical protein